MIDAFLIAVWGMVSASAPWLLFGFLLAGVLKVAIPERVILRFLNGGGVRSIFWATLIGLPLPLCSCGVVPVAVSLRKRGASRGATASFMISTPEIGVDSFLLSWFVLNPTIAIARVVAAFCSAFSVGLLVDYASGVMADGQPGVVTGRCECGQGKSGQGKSGMGGASQDCVADAAPSSDSRRDVGDGDAGGNCCDAPAVDTKKKSPVFMSTVIDVVYYGFYVMVKDLAPLLVFGILLSGFVEILVPDQFFQTANLNPHLAMLLMFFVSLPLYVCSVSSVPLAVSLLEKGLFPGAVIMFLLVGPASNVATLLAVRRELGKRALAYYVLCIGVVSYVVGYSMNFFASASQLQGGQISGHVHGETIYDYFSLACSVILVAMLLFGCTVRVVERLGNSGGNVGGNGAKKKVAKKDRCCSAD